MAPNPRSLIKEYIHCSALYLILILVSPIIAQNSYFFPEELNKMIFTLCAEEKRNIQNIKLLCASNICRIFVESID